MVNHHDSRVCSLAPSRQYSRAVSPPSSPAHNPLYSQVGNPAASRHCSPVSSPVFNPLGYQAASRRFSLAHNRADNPQCNLAANQLYSLVTNPARNQPVCRVVSHPVSQAVSRVRSPPLNLQHSLVGRLPARPRLSLVFSLAVNPQSNQLRIPVCSLPHNPQPSLLASRQRDQLLLQVPSRVCNLRRHLVISRRQGRRVNQAASPRLCQPAIRPLNPVDSQWVNQLVSHHHSHRCNPHHDQVLNQLDVLLFSPPMPRRHNQRNSLPAAPQLSRRFFRLFSLRCNLPASLLGVQLVNRRFNQHYNHISNQAVNRQDSRLLLPRHNRLGNQLKGLQDNLSLCPAHYPLLSQQSSRLDSLRVSRRHGHQHNLLTHLQKD